ncbi:MAG: SAM-dependent chlorinase/fluorinase [Burkholderiales bacterium]|nr:SAM-dependent chlorinase/fluorinase [Burkholderiales bacterium]
MAIVLFTDFGAADLYVGQVHVVLDRYAPGVRVIDLMHDAPAGDVRAAAHLLAALTRQVPRGHVLMAVVDPGVGTDRGAVVMRADGRTFVGPDNGLLSVVAARATTKQLWQIVTHPPDISASFHGRDLFAPMAAAVATDDFPNERVKPVAALAVAFPADDLAEVIYVDHFGNAMTGIRAGSLAREQRLRAGRAEVGYARVFGEAPPGGAFWYENSLGLVEIAVNGASAREVLGLAPGQAVERVA